jgi:hypothetical protein
MYDYKIKTLRFYVTALKVALPRFASQSTPYHQLLLHDTPAVLWHSHANLPSFILEPMPRDSCVL